MCLACCAQGGCVQSSGFCFVTEIGLRCQCRSQEHIIGERLFQGIAFLEFALIGDTDDSLIARLNVYARDCSLSVCDPLAVKILSRAGIYRAICSPKGTASCHKGSSCTLVRIFSGRIGPVSDKFFSALFEKRDELILTEIPGCRSGYLR